MHTGLTFDNNGLILKFWMRRGVAIFQLANELISGLIDKVKTENDLYGTYLDTTVFQGLRMELVDIQNSLQEDYFVALNAVAALLPYFPPDHFTSRISDLLIWRRPLLVISDGHVGVTHSIDREHFPSDMSTFPEAFRTIVAEHLGAYFESLYNLLDKSAETNLQQWTHVSSILSQLTKVMLQYIQSSKLDENYIKYVHILNTLVLELECYKITIQVHWMMMPSLRASPVHEQQLIIQNKWIFVFQEEGISLHPPSSKKWWKCKRVLIIPKTNDYRYMLIQSVIQNWIPKS